MSGVWERGGGVRLQWARQPIWEGGLLVAPITTGAFRRDGTNTLFQPKVGKLYGPCGQTVPNGYTGGPWNRASPVGLLVGLSTTSTIQMLIFRLQIARIIDCGSKIHCNHTNEASGSLIGPLDPTKGYQ